MALPEQGFRDRVEAVVAQIPQGRVMTYGQLAALCGNARAARIVGGIAHFGDPELPWQRVVNKKGGLASGYPGGRKGHAEALRTEGYDVSDDYFVKVDELLWWPGDSVSRRQTADGNSAAADYVLPSALLVIVGETASGKSALALDLAERLNGEIICADSWTVRREVNIGTAKPSAAEQARIPHHLLDVAGPDEDFTAAVFKRMAEATIADITSRGKLPILVGGTGLYIDGILFDYGFLPEGDRRERESLNVLSNEELLHTIANKGLELGDVDTRNKRRLIRLIETNGAAPTRKAMRQNTCVIGLQVDREILNERIEKRVDSMLKSGLENEVRGLVDRYGWGCEALKGVGYAQWQDYLAGTKNIDETRAAIIKSTKDLAKRQRTWFKRNKSIRWFSTPVNVDSVVAYVTTSLDK